VDQCRPCAPDSVPSRGVAYQTLPHRSDTPPTRPKADCTARPPALGGRFGRASRAPPLPQWGWYPRGARLWTADPTPRRRATDDLPTERGWAATRRLRPAEPRPRRHPLAGEGGVSDRPVAGEGGVSDRPAACGDGAAHCGSSALRRGAAAPPLRHLPRPLSTSHGVGVHVFSRTPRRVAVPRGTLVPQKRAGFPSAAPRGPARLLSGLDDPQWQHLAGGGGGLRACALHADGRRHGTGTP